MSWQMVGTINVAGVRVGLSVMPSETRLRVLLNKEIMHALGIGFGDCVNVLRGLGDDEGLMRIARAGRRVGRSYIVRPTNPQSRCAGRVSFVAWPSLDVSKRQPARAVDWVLNTFDGQTCVDFNLPAWAGRVKFLDRPRSAA